MFPSIHKITIPTPIHSPKYFDDFPKAFIRDTIRKKNIMTVVFIFKLAFLT